jgi:abhydrolase domain-containing protein 17
LFSHGNAEDIGMIFEWFKEVALQLSCNVFGYDYTGYGLSYSDVGPAENYCFSDIQAAFDYLNGTEGIFAKDIILYGRSLGSGASCELAMRQSKKGDPVAGVILQSPLMSAYRVAFSLKYTMP